MLVLTLDSYDNSLQIGDDVTLYFEQPLGMKFYKKVRVKIDAPKHVKILRGKAKKRTPPEGV